MAAASGVAWHQWRRAAVKNSETYRMLVAAGMNCGNMMPYALL